MTENPKQKITKTISIIVLILLFTVGAYTYPKPQPTEAKAEVPSLEQLEEMNKKALEEAQKALKDKEIEAKILELKKEQEGLKVQR